MLSGVNCTALGLAQVACLVFFNGSARLELSDI